MNVIQTATETLIRKIKLDIHTNTVLVFSDDVFEVQKIPCLILQGPKLSENKLRRSQSHLFERDIGNRSYEECSSPRLYHLDFDFVVTVAYEQELLQFQDTFARFFQLSPTLAIEDKGSLNLTELIPLGGLNRVNLSNLKQSSGRIRIEDCPVYDGKIENGRLIEERSFQMTTIK